MVQELSQDMHKIINKYYNDHLVHDYDENLLNNFKRRLIDNKTVLNNLNYIIQHENDHKNTHRVYYHGMRSRITNLYLFAETILKSLNHTDKYYYRGIVNGNTKVPNGMICCTPYLYKNIENNNNGEHIFDFMDNNQLHGRDNYQSANFTIDVLLNELCCRKIIMQSNIESLKNIFNDFDNDNLDSHMLMEYNISNNKSNIAEWYNRARQPKCLSNNGHLSPDNIDFHIELKNINPNDDGIIINQYHNIENLNLWLDKVKASFENVA